MHHSLHPILHHDVCIELQRALLGLSGLLFDPEWLILDVDHRYFQPVQHIKFKIQLALLRANRVPNFGLLRVCWNIIALSGILQLYRLPLVYNYTLSAIYEQYCESNYELHGPTLPFCQRQESRTYRKTNEEKELSYRNARNVITLNLDFSFTFKILSY